MNVLFICTSGKDRSPALVTYFSATIPENNYRCAGVNKYFCERKGTHYLTKEDIEWADFTVFAEPIHKDIIIRDFKEYAPLYYGDEDLYWVILSCGEYEQGSVGDDYLMKADLKLKDHITEI